MKVSEMQEQLEALILAELELHYHAGLGMDSILEKRLQQEWQEAAAAGGFQQLLLCYEIKAFWKSRKLPFGVNGSLSSSFLSWLLGITLTNPLPPHRYCPHCGGLQWHPEYEDGFDIPGQVCPRCGEEMLSDGHDILSRMHWNGPRPVAEIWTTAAGMEDTIQWLLDHKWEIQIQTGEQGSIWAVCVGNVKIHFLEMNFPEDFYEREISFRQMPQLLKYKHEQREKLGLPEPGCFSELLKTVSKIYQLEWCKSEAQKSRCRRQTQIAYRDQVYDYFLRHGSRDAWKQTQQVLFGHGVGILTEEMKAAPDAYLLDIWEDCPYLWRKSCITENVLKSLRGAVIPDGEK